MNDEKFQLSPDEVAALDPFGTRDKSTSSELADLLETSDKPLTNKESFKNDILNNEIKSWEMVLGVKPEIIRVPDFVTPEVISTLKTYGFGLRYIPEFPLKHQDLEDMTVGILEKCQNAYPNWKPFYSVLREDYKKRETINIDKFYWQSIRDRHIKFPSQSGKWVAVETYQNPPSFNFENMLGLSDRGNLTYFEVNELFEEKGEDIINLLDLKSSFGYIRLPTVFEYNLLANREKWCKSNYTEWVSEEYINTESNVNYNLVMGDLETGGPGYISTIHDYRKQENIGFRILIPVL